MAERVGCQCQVEDRKIPAFIINNFLRRLFQPPEKFLTKYLAGGDTAADLGCGPGYFTLPMAKIVGKSGKIHAVDFDRRAIERLAARASRQGYSGTIEGRAASASEINHIENGSVDFVLAEGLLCCMKDHAGAVEQIKRILAPDGRAYLSVMKFAKKGDPRGVPNDEWLWLLAGFRVLASGEGPFNRWALVSANGGNKSREPILVGQAV